ncbi:Succinate dehydrogenase cytochrome b-556 subunit [hydrothermal vent metagenome]|uniref:Succinate dehydrogenase cytochrome b-556 subunit n=1 Tax=hydrothermal vent metagenome TaxID=652676 RepID=A0A3B0Z3N2_9ZZZZ
MDYFNKQAKLHNHMVTKQKRPIFLDIRRIHLPVTAITSILHRISGVILFLSIPFVIQLLAMSLADEAEYGRAAELLDGVWVKLFLLMALWSLLHHVLAGVRFLLLDIDVGIEREQARRSALIVNIVAAALAVIIGWVVVL